MATCDWWRCTERAEQTVVLPERTVSVCREHTRRLGIAHREGLRITVDPLYVPHPLSQEPRPGREPRRPTPLRRIGP